jgi:tetratricopeptide (TPR) repeat protein
MSLYGAQMSREFIAILILLWAFSFHANAQQAPPVQRKDSVVVSAGISKEQLALEDKLNAIISDGDQALKSGDAAAAIKQYENARDLVQKEPLLAEQQDRTMKKLGTGYFRGKRMKEAIQIFSDRVDTRKKDCESESTAVSNCADAESDLCVAKMYDNNFNDALTCYQDVEAKYVKAQKFSDIHEFTMIEAMHGAEAKVSISLMLYQLGRTPEAIVSTEAAIKELSSVQNDENIQQGIRDEAANSLQVTQGLLARLKGVQ